AEEDGRVLGRGARRHRQRLRELPRRGARLPRQPRAPEVRRRRQRQAPPRPAARERAPPRRRRQRGERARPPAEGPGLSADARGRDQPRGARRGPFVDPGRSPGPAALKSVTKTAAWSQASEDRGHPPLSRYTDEDPMKFETPEIVEIKMDAEI